MSRSPVELSMAAVQLVQKKPRTAPELAGLLGVERSHAMAYLNAMEREGLVDRTREGPKGHRGAPANVFTWSHE